MYLHVLSPINLYRPSWGLIRYIARGIMSQLTFVERGTRCVYNLIQVYSHRSIGVEAQPKIGLILIYHIFHCVFMFWTKRWIFWSCETPGRENIQGQIYGGVLNYTGSGILCPIPPTSIENTAYRMFKSINQVRYLGKLTRALTGLRNFFREWSWLGMSPVVSTKLGFN